MTDKLSICMPKSKAKHRPVEHLIELGQKLHRSLSYLVVEATLQYSPQEGCQ